MIPIQDEQLRAWLAALGKYINPCNQSGHATQILLELDVRVEDCYVQIWCANLPLAVEVCQVAEAFQNDKYGLRIWVGRKLLYHIPPSHIQKIGANSMINQATTTRSTWVKANRPVAAFMQSHHSLSIHSRNRDQGYPCLEVLPLMGVEAVLCKPIAELMGAPANSATGIIGVTKERVIREAIASGETTIGHYEMMWNGVPWKKKISAILLDGTEEVMIVTEGEAWHNDYWRNFVAK